MIGTVNDLVIIHGNHRANLKGPKVSIQDHASSCLTHNPHRRKRLAG